MLGAGSCYGGGFQQLGQRLVRSERRMNLTKQRTPWRKPAPHYMRRETGVTGHLSVQLWSKANSQDNAEVPSGQVTDCPWLAQPKYTFKLYRTSVEWPKTGSSQTLPLMELERIWQEEWDNLPNPSVINCGDSPKKTWKSNCCQMGFCFPFQNKFTTQWSVQKLMMCEYFQYSMVINSALITGTNWKTSPLSQQQGCLPPNRSNMDCTSFLERSGKRESYFHKVVKNNTHVQILIYIFSYFIFHFTTYFWD